jgi:uncharacterized protein (TIGR03435 family)
LKLTLTAILLSSGILAQSPPRFEAASIKPSAWKPATGAPGERGTGDGCPTSMKLDPARVEIQCATMAMLIGYAFRHPPDRVKGPDWMMTVGTQRWDIVATLPESAAGHIPEMLQALLAGRFQLALHRGATSGPVYALIASRSGLKMKEAAAAPAADAVTDVQPVGFYGTVQDRVADGVMVISSPRMGSVRQTDGADHNHQRWDAESISFEGLAELLDKVAPMSVPIVDKTGLKGRFQMTLEVEFNDLGNPAEMEARVVRAFNDGLRKLGLQLERRRGEVPTLIVDHVEKTPTEN